MSSQHVVEVLVQCRTSASRWTSLLREDVTQLLVQAKNTEGNAIAFVSDTKTITRRRQLHVHADAPRVVPPLGGMPCEFLVMRLVKELGELLSSIQACRIATCTTGQPVGIRTGKKKKEDKQLSSDF